MTQWPLVSLGEICEVLDSRRKPVTKSDRVTGPYPYYGATGVQDYVAEFIFDERLLLLGEDGAKWGVGDRSAFIIEGKTWVNNHAHVLRPNRDLVLDEWLEYFLVLSDLTPFVTGVTVPKLNQAKMREIQIPLPPLSEQKKLLAHLQSKFDEVDELQRVTQKQRAIAKSVFESYRDELLQLHTKEIDFVDFGDVGRFVRGPFGGSLKKSMFVPEGFAIYEQQHAINDQFESFRYFIDPSKFKQMERFSVAPDDLIMSCSGTFGKIAIVPEGAPQGIINQALLKITPDSRVLPEFLRHWMQSGFFQKSLTDSVGGAALQNVPSVGEMKKFQVKIPSEATQLFIVSALNEFEIESKKLSDVLLRKKQIIENFRNSVTHDYFFGAAA